MGSEEEKVEVGAVSAKLPMFWPSNPRAWFLQAEAQFTLRSITTDDTKFCHVIAALDPSIAASCTAILESTPTTNKYPYLKKALTDRFQLSEEERADRLLEMQTLGDRRPSELAETILELNADQPAHFLLRRIFMRALPPQVRSALSTSSKTDLRELAREADRAITNTGRHAAVCTLGNDVTATMSSEIDAVSTRRQRQLCSYHRRWGMRAKKCIQPCDWTPSPPVKHTPGNAQWGPR